VRRRASAHIAAMGVLALIARLVVLVISVLQTVWRQLHRIATRVVQETFVTATTLILMWQMIARRRQFPYPQQRTRRQVRQRALLRGLLVK